MTRRLWLLLAALLTCAALAAGCGDDDDDGGGDSGGGGGDTAAQTDTGGGGGGDSTEGEERSESDPSVERAVEACKDSVEQQPQLSEDLKDDLLELCEEAAQGDEGDAREAAREVCVRIVEESVPEGSPGRDAAIDACEQGTDTP